MVDVGFLGLGRMGGPMATHLVRAGFSLTVHDPDAAAAARLTALGAAAADSPAAVARLSQVVVAMLPPAAVEDAVGGPDGVLAGLDPGGVIVDGGNSHPAASRRLAELCRGRGVEMLDVGVSGGPSGAAAGTLAVMVGGGHEAFERCRPLFEAFGREIAYLGPSGSGHLAKLVNNMIVGMSWAVVAEALTFAEAAGLDVAELTRVIPTGAARSWALEQAARLYHDPIPEAADRFMRGRPSAGQLTWALEQAVELGVPLPISGLVHELQKLAHLPEPPPAQALLRRIIWRSAGVAEPVPPPGA
jgi:3-hydroxyisobutyrate dehydrogenase-like beta-hydroxyacid dehydrogenase